MFAIGVDTRLLKQNLHECYCSITENGVSTSPTTCRSNMVTMANRILKYTKIEQQRKRTNIDAFENLPN
jgi:hypothetical protein